MVQYRSFQKGNFINVKKDMNNKNKVANDISSPRNRILKTDKMIATRRHAAIGNR